MMRKVVFSVVGVFAVVATTASLVTVAGAAAKPPLARVSVSKCGGLYQPPCVKPTVIVRSAVACRKTGKILRFPVRLHSLAGLSRATVKVGSRTIKTFRFKGGPNDKTVTVVVNTHGDKPGLYTITVKATDTRGKSSTARAHFTICRPAPVFTG